MTLTIDDFQRIDQWMCRNARPLEFSLWNYRFKNGDKEDVFNALRAFQNEDGGFGHALEPDSHNPLSSPLQTSDAIEIIEAIGGCSVDHPLVEGILRYLDSGKDFHQDRWNLILASNDLYPHAPWWDTVSDSAERSEYNPTAMLCGFGLKYAKKNTDIWMRCQGIAHGLIHKHMIQGRIEMHPLLCLAFLYNILLQLDVKDEDFLIAYDKLISDERKLILEDLGSMESYKCFPSHFICTKQHPLYPAMRNVLDEDLDRRITHRNNEGLWELNWVWGTYPEDFAVSTLWWKARIAIKNCTLLNNFDRIEGR